MHYEVVFRAMGAKFFWAGGTQDYWPSSGVFPTDPELLEMGDDVIFGSRSDISMRDRLRTAKVVIGNGLPGRRHHQRPHLAHHHAFRARILLLLKDEDDPVLCILYPLVAALSGPSALSSPRRSSASSTSNKPPRPRHGNGNLLLLVVPRGHHLHAALLAVAYLRVMGARVARDCGIYPGRRVGLMTEPDLVKLGDNISLDDCFVVAHMNSHGNFALNSLQTGNVPPSIYLFTSDTNRSRLLSDASMEDESTLCEHLCSHHSTPACDRLLQSSCAQHPTTPHYHSATACEVHVAFAIRARMALFSCPTPPPATPPDGSALRAMQPAASPAYLASSTREPASPTESTTLDDEARWCRPLISAMCTRFLPLRYGRGVPQLPPAGVGWREAVISRVIKYTGICAFCIFLVVKHAFSIYKRLSGAPNE
ncbi:hypothetical protein B0H11DRAFT_2389673 [Mycena galericulata]|nr:hypothetical protein B0H11DRAFT_2389673 [Mycena galericulata]